MVTLDIRKDDVWECNTHHIESSIVKCSSYRAREREMDRESSLITVMEQIVIRVKAAHSNLTKEVLSHPCRKNEFLAETECTLF